MPYSWVQAGRGKATCQAAIQQNYRVMYRETHVLLEDLAEAVAERTRLRRRGAAAPLPTQNWSARTVRRRADLIGSQSLGAWLPLH